MKKVLLLSVGFAFFMGCSSDTEIIQEAENIDLTKIVNPDTAKAASEFDNTSNGIYKGVFVSDDISYHGVLTVNLGNDAQYNAILEYGDDQRIGFVRTSNGASGLTNNIEFRGVNAGFTLNVSDHSEPIVTNGYVDGQGAQIKLLKETSGNQVRAVLGTFTEDADPTFMGTWDLLASGPQVPVTIPTGEPGPFPPPFVTVDVNIITSVVLTRSGTMFTDATLEMFTPGAGCGTTLPPGPQAPFFTGDVLLFGGLLDVNEFGAATQQSMFDGDLAQWNLIFSKYQGNKYYDANCTEILGGGTWAWKGRTGKILLVP